MAVGLHSLYYSQGSTLRLLHDLPTGQVPLQFDLPKSKFYLPKTKITQKVTFKSLNVKLRIDKGSGCVLRCSSIFLITPLVLVVL